MRQPACATRPAAPPPAVRPRAPAWGRRGAGGKGAWRLAGPKDAERRARAPPWEHSHRRLKPAPGRHMGQLGVCSQLEYPRHMYSSCCCRCNCFIRSRCLCCCASSSACCRLCSSCCCSSSNACGLVDNSAPARGDAPDWFAAAACSAWWPCRTCRARSDCCDALCAIGTCVCKQAQQPQHGTINRLELKRQRRSGRTTRNCRGYTRTP